jgi:beta-glucosidase
MKLLKLRNLKGKFIGASLVKKGTYKMNLKQLLKTLTIEEKIGQLMQLAPFFFKKDSKVEVIGSVRHLDLDEDEIFLAGSVLGIGHQEEMMSIQKKYLEKSRHKIPLVFMADIIHGYESIFPIPLALACSFNPSLVEQASKVSALEAQTAGIHVTFAPMSDVSRDPRWGRVMESFGEDPYLASLMSAATVKGFQGTDISKVGHLASCVKHFAAYGAVEAGRDYNTVEMSMHQFYNVYAPPYEAAIKAGTHLAMMAFNTFNGIPCTVHDMLIQNILKEEMHFKGVVITDYDGLQQVIAHGVAKDRKDAAYQGIKAGIDIEMMSTTYIKHLKTLVEEGRVDIKLIDDAVMRILELKKKLGLFEDPYKGASTLDASDIVMCESHLEQTRKIAHECAVLLKNDGLLPINKKAKLALIGPYANNQETNGAWSWHGDTRKNKTLAESFLEQQHQVIFYKNGHHIDDYDEYDINEIRNADLVILCLGEHERETGEAKSKTKLDLPRGQASLLQLAKSLNKKTVTILFNGRPLVLSDLISSEAILETWFLGSRAADAIVDLINGSVNPSGKLAMTFVQNEGQIPLYYNHLNTGRPYRNEYNEYVSKYLDVSNEPQFYFGHGLSYSKFIYQSIEANDRFKKTNQIKVKIKNDSNYAGFEVVQLYIKDEVSKPVRPIKELKAFQKVWFEANETKTVTFKLNQSDLAYKDSHGRPCLEEGFFTISIGGSSQTELSKQVYFKEEIDDYS